MRCPFCGHDETQSKTLDRLKTTARLEEDVEKLACVKRFINFKEFSLES